MDFDTRSARSDQMVWRYLRNGDRKAFEFLYTAYYPILLGRFRSKWGLSAEAAEDTVQETFLQGDRHRGKVEDHTKFGAWLTTIADRQAMALLNGRKTGTAPSEVPSGDAADVELHSSWVEADPEDAIVDSFVMRAAVNALPPELKAVVNLHHYEGYTFTEIGQLLDVTSSTAHRLLSIARKRLALQLSVFTGPANTGSRRVQPRTQRQQAIAQLSPRRREVLERHIDRGMRPVDIAKDLGISAGCARVHLHLAYKELAGRLGLPDHKVLVTELRSAAS